MSCIALITLCGLIVWPLQFCLLTFLWPLKVFMWPCSSTAVLITFCMSAYMGSPCVSGRSKKPKIGNPISWQFFPVMLAYGMPHKKFQLQKMSPSVPPSPLKNESSPSKDQNFFVTKYGNIYPKRCILKNLSPENKSFWKMSNLTWVMTKKLAKNIHLVR